MASVNKCIFLGNLTKDPELKYTPAGVAICSFSLAMNTRRTGQDGGKIDETLFMRCVAFKRLAENIAQYTVKGQTIYVEGRLQQKAWTDNSGVERTSIELLVGEAQFISMKGRGGSSQDSDDGQALAGPAADSADGDMPFA